MKKTSARSGKQNLISLESLGNIFRIGNNDTAEGDEPVTLRVLVVDDHPASAEGLRDYLREWGHDARVAGGVQEAISVLEGWNPDAVVCDLLMPPGPGGMEMLREVRARDPWVGFIMLTGHGSIEDAVRATRDGAFDFLTKPVDLDRLRLLLDRLAERNEMRSEVTRLRHRLATLGDTGSPGQPLARDAQARQTCSSASRPRRLRSWSPARAARARTSSPRRCTISRDARASRSSR
jgi:DNA-binding response OmpR family regulator